MPPYPAHVGGDLPDTLPLHHRTMPVDVHSFNEMPSIYQTLANRQVPNVPKPRKPVYDPLADITKRESEIRKERDLREHELRMEYEKRLEEFEADF